ncbi:MAG: hypothetical protein Q9202_004801 [Teloschistes flavicans]
MVTLCSAIHLVDEMLLQAKTPHEVAPRRQAEAAMQATGTSILIIAPQQVPNCRADKFIVVIMTVRSCKKVRFAKEKMLGANHVRG